MTIETMLDYFTIRRTVEFIKAQPEYANQGIRQYVAERAQDLNMSITETVEDLTESAIDLWIDRNEIL
jgi:uncharacterized protein (DUF2164 family)